MKKKIIEENKALILKAEEIFPEVWKWMQREANRETPMDIVLFALEQMVKQNGGVANPWGFLEVVVKTKQNREEIVEREEAWNRRKIKREEDIRDWFKSFLTK